MILVDTSVWVDHLRFGDERMAELLGNGAVVCHPLIVGELACGGLSRRAETLRFLRGVPALPMVSDHEAHALLENRRLFTLGVGWIDVHLLASALVGALPMWTRDLALARAAKLVGLPTASD